jgi:hypothetical protein
MCGLCGLFGSTDHWTAASASLRVFPGARTRRAERAEHVRVANAVLGAFAIRLDDWQGSSFVVSGPTGRREMAATLPEVWQAAAAMAGRKLDPLDPVLIARLTGGLR